VTWYARLLDGVSPSLAGAKIVPLETLKRALGARAIEVWMRLCARRDGRTGMTHVSLHGIATAPWQKGAKRMAPRSVQASLARLRDAHLVIDHGRKWARVAQGAARVVRQVWFRQVLGAVLARDVSGRDEVVIPRETAAWLSTAHGWGGARAGAGRPKKSTTVSDSSVHVRNQVSASEGEIKSVSRSIDHKTKKILEGTDASLREKQAADAADGFSLDEEVGALGASLGSVRTEVSPAFGSVRDLPPYPGASVVRAAIVPPPPRLHPDDGWERHLALMARAYEGACCHRWPLEQRAKTRKRGPAKGQTYLLRPTGMLGQPTSAKWDSFRDVLREAADLLITLDVAPHAWASFSAMRWKGMSEHKNGERTGKVAHWPPVAWLWSPTRIAQDAQSEAVAECAEGGRAVYGPAHKELLARYAQAHRAASLRGASAQVSGETMTRDEYDRLVAIARKEAQEIQDDLRRRARAGEWLW
jgi:hypothetical protein